MRLVHMPVLFMSALAAASCVPAPHYHYEIPKIAGCVVDAGSRPLEGIGIELRSLDEELIWKGRTDSQGKFLFPGKKEFQFFRYVEFGDEVMFIRVNLYKDSVLAFSETYDFASLRRWSEDRNIVDFTRSSELPEHMGTHGCFSI